jgi:uncharacterized protein (DUF433 family)
MQQAGLRNAQCKVSKMSTATYYPHVVIDASGAARIDHTRYKVEHLAAEHFHHGWTAEELLRQHPDLRPEQVYAALAYFYDHHDEMITQLESSSAAAERARQSHGLSREELLKRRDSRTP